MRYLLDTDTCIEVIRLKEPVSSRVRGKSPDDLALSVMTLAELRFGALNSTSPDRALAAVKAFISAPFQVLPFDRQGADHHANIRLALRGKPIGDRDLVIAATARAHGLTVVTGNRRHFDRVPNLSSESWTDPIPSS